MTVAKEPRAPSDFIRAIVSADVAAGLERVVTRFPPEPNGYPHIGHAKPICLNFWLAEEYGGLCRLRFDDTNPSRESQEFVDAIQRDILWLGFDAAREALFASDYFERMYDFAVQLVRKGRAYVCDLSAEELREYRGTLTEPGRDSPQRERSVDESLDLFARMRAGEFPDGTHTLRARIDMASPNINLRDPVLYRIQHVRHFRVGGEWCVYPSYDFAQPISDALEGVTHSLCTIEFENHRPLYDWILEELDIFRSRQIEFGPLRLGFTVLSKRRLRKLVEDGVVLGWDDPRMPTLCGLRRRGFPPEAIRDFAARVGVARKDQSRVDLALLEHCAREELNRSAPRRMAVIDPLRLVIENYPEGQVEHFEAINNPEDPSAGSRQVPFSRELWIERDDFREDPPRKFHRLAPGKEVRLRAAYFVTCTGFEKDEAGEISEVRCRYDPETRGGDAPDGRKVKGTLHWVAAAQASAIEVRLYDRLWTTEDVGEEEDPMPFLNESSLLVRPACYAEPSAASLPPGTRVQFERLGYFCVDLDSTPERPVWNRTVPLRDSWAKIQKRS